MHLEFEFIRDVAQKNGYPLNFIDGQIKNTLNRAVKRYGGGSSTTLKKGNAESVKKTEFTMIKLPYIGSSTKQFIRRVQHLAKKEKPSLQLLVVPTPPPTVGQKFNNKDNIPKSLQSGVVYHFACNNCPSHYIGETTRQVIRRMWEHGYRELKSAGEYESVQTTPHIYDRYGIKKIKSVKRKTSQVSKRYSTNRC